MGKTYKNQLATMFAVCAFACAASMPLFAAAETEVEKAPIDAEAALEMLEEARSAVEEAEAAIESDEAKEPDYFEYAEEYLAEAEAAYEEEDYDETAHWSKKTIDKARFIVTGAVKKDEHGKHQDDKHGKSDEEKDASSHGSDKYRDYGKSDNYEELQAQLDELMQLLIQLLTLQLAEATS